MSYTWKQIANEPENFHANFDSFNRVLSISPAVSPPYQQHGIAQLLFQRS